jgi:hypothetical protein
MTPEEVPARCPAAAYGATRLAWQTRPLSVYRKSRCGTSEARARLAASVRTSTHSSLGVVAWSRSGLIYDEHFALYGFEV